MPIINVQTLIQNTYTVKVPIQNVRDFGLDSQKLWSHVPGCEKMELLGKNTYHSLVGVKVGPYLQGSISPPP